MHGLLLFIGIDKCLKHHEEVYSDCDVDPTSADISTVDSVPDNVDHDHEHDLATDLDNNVDDVIDHNSVSVWMTV